MVSVPGSGTHPGRRSGSARSRNSPGIEASSSGRWSISVSAVRLVGKKRYLRWTPAARAASNASAPKRSVTNATRRPVVVGRCLRLRSASVSAGTARTHSSDMSVSMAASRGRSDMSTGGSAMDATAGGIEARNARCVADAVDANVMSVDVTPWRWARRFASSASGIRWPIPGVASIATCGGGVWVPSPLRQEEALAFSIGACGAVFSHCRLSACGAAVPGRVAGVYTRSRLSSGIRPGRVVPTPGCVSGNNAVCVISGAKGRSGLVCTEQPWIWMTGLWVPSSATYWANIFPLASFSARALLGQFLFLISFSFLYD
uniref:Uncharacterized protein n=1 Tax=Zea mays TaxID=4577 RepID=A0A804NJQ9_MAIZE